MYNKGGRGLCDIQQTTDICEIMDFLLRSTST